MSLYESNEYADQMAAEHCLDMEQKQLRIGRLRNRLQNSRLTAMACRDHFTKRALLDTLSILDEMLKELRA